jgi:hypothetical protein
VQVCPTRALQSASRHAKTEPAYPGCPLSGRGPDLVPKGGKRIQVRFQHLLSRGARARCFARRLQRQLVVVLNKACSKRGQASVAFTELLQSKMDAPTVLAIYPANSMEHKCNVRLQKSDVAGSVQYFLQTTAVSTVIGISQPSLQLTCRPS